LLRRRAVATAGLALLCSFRSAPAQRRIEFTPFLGGYYALGGLGRQGTGVEERQENHVALGAALVLHLSPTFGVEGAVAATPSGVNLSGTTNPGLSGRVVFASVRARVSTAQANVYGLGGLGMVIRAGPAWSASQYTNLTSVAGILGVGAQAQVSTTTRIDLRAELNFYSIDPDGAGTMYKPALQSDLLVGIGIPIALTHRVPAAPSSQPAVATIAVDPEELVLRVGETHVVSARSLDAHGRAVERPVAWRSEDEGVARVSQDGVVAGIGAGRARVTANSDGVTGSTSVTVEAPIAANAAAVMIAEVAVGRRHTCARTAGGRVWCWGDNAAGQVQAGAGPMVSHPTTLEAHEAGSLSAGGAHTCGLRDEQAICWGSNRDGQLGNADHGAREVVIAAKRFASLSAGGQHTCGLTVEATVLCWGKNDFGQLGDGTTNGRSAPMSIAASGPFVALAAGVRHSCALHRDGRVLCWGDDWSGQVGSGMTQSILEPTEVGGTLRFAAIAAGEDHTCGVTRDGRAYCWGLNTSGQLGDGSKRQHMRPGAVTTSELWAAVAAGGAYTCALNRSGRAFCWGRGQEGQLGGGTTTERLVPTAIRSTEAFVMLAAGERHACGVTRNGLVLCWGSNARGELGTGAPTASPAPTPVSGFVP